MGIVIIVGAIIAYVGICEPHLITNHLAHWIGWK